MWSNGWYWKVTRADVLSIWLMPFRLPKIHWSSSFSLIPGSWLAHPIAGSIWSPVIGRFNWRKIIGQFIEWSHWIGRFNPMNMLYVDQVGLCFRPGIPRIRFASHKILAIDQNCHTMFNVELFESMVHRLNEHPHSITRHATPFNLSYLEHVSIASDEYMLRYLTLMFLLGSNPCRRFVV